jgi:hypothetical protein
VIERREGWHWPAIVSGAVTLIGALSGPAVLAVLPAKISAGVVVLGAVLQAFTAPLPRRPADARTRQTDEHAVQP